jgi:CDP-diacylglycerol--glycerol-3-phosphate 3-phosphatidyltransferase
MNGVIPNSLSLLRLPLAFLFLSENPMVRCGAIILAMASDILDGYVARCYQQTSQFGAILDPLTDKFFALFVFVVLLAEEKLTGLQMAALLSRDFAVILFGCYLLRSSQWAQYRCRAIFCGKVTTSLQFVVLLALSVGFAVPAMVYGAFVLLGVCALLELFLKNQSVKA